MYVITANKYTKRQQLVRRATSARNSPHPQGGLHSGFDPDALERGAKALREISSSEHGKKVRAAR